MSSVPHAPTPWSVITLGCNTLLPERPSVHRDERMSGLRGTRTTFLLLLDAPRRFGNTLPITAGLKTAA